MPIAGKIRKRTEIYETILDLAIELFSTYGFDSVSTPQIAKAAGVSQPTIHYHFGNKLELWKTAVRKVYTKVESQIDFEPKEFASSAPIDGLRTLYTTLYKICLNFYMKPFWPEITKLLLVKFLKVFQLGISNLTTRSILCLSCTAHS